MENQEVNNNNFSISIQQNGTIDISGNDVSEKTREVIFEAMQQAEYYRQQAKEQAKQERQETNLHTMAFFVCIVTVITFFTYSTVTTVSHFFKQSTGVQYVR